MAKIIKNPVSVEITKDDSQRTVFINYGLGTDEYPDIEIRKRMAVPALTPQELVVVNQIITWATSKAAEQEGIG